MSLEDSGFIKIVVDPKSWAEIVELSKKDEGVGRELIARIHKKNMELDKFWNASTLRQRIKCFRKEMVAVNSGDWDSVCKVHKVVSANFPRVKLIMEYDRIIGKIIEEFKPPDDDGGEHE